jgi:hypothetical protein
VAAFCTITVGIAPPASLYRTALRLINAWTVARIRDPKATVPHMRRQSRFTDSSA